MKKRKAKKIAKMSLSKKMLWSYKQGWNDALKGIALVTKTYKSIDGDGILRNFCEKWGKDLKLKKSVLKTLKKPSKK